MIKLIINYILSFYQIIPFSLHGRITLFTLEIGEHALMIINWYKTLLLPEVNIRKHQLHTYFNMNRLQIYQHVTL